MCPALNDVELSTAVRCAAPWAVSWFTAEECEMRISRPVSVLALIGIMVAGAAWYAPPQHHTAQVSVMLPSDVYQLLSEKGQTEVDAAGRPRSVVQVIEGFAKR